MAVLVTGAAGFIGFHVANLLLARGDHVLGIDNLNDYYDPALKNARLAELYRHSRFRFAQIDIADHEALCAVAGDNAIDQVVHLAAQAGVRHSFKVPFAYIRANILGHLSILEYCRARTNFKHLVYASSSSVYGSNEKLPYATTDRVDHPLSLYAATKRADELMSDSYAHLYQIPQTGLRFFTVYGPWGRPDMAVYSFAQAIATGKPIKLFNSGDMQRDFTYIDDVAKGIVSALDKSPSRQEAHPIRLYNIGNNHPEKITYLVQLLSKALGQPALIDNAPMQRGEVKMTFADIENARHEIGYAPSTSLADGIEKFVAWFRTYHRPTE